MVQRRLRPQPGAPAGRRGRRPAELPPGCFAAVMATGIISVAAHQHRQGTLSTALFMAALSTYALLAAVMVARLIRWPRQVRRTLAAPSARFGALTIVAASGVLGVRAVLGGAVWAGEALEVVAILAWAPLSISAVAGVLAARLSWRRQADGTWLLLVVATESLAVLAATLAAVRPSPALAVVGLCWLGLDLACYFPLTVLIGVRLLSARSRLRILTPTTGSCPVPCRSPPWPPPG